MNKIGKIFIGSGIFLVLVSIILFGYYQYEEYDAGRKSASVLSMIKDNIVENNVNIIDVVEVRGMSTLSIEGYDYIGTLMIPSLNLELPVMSDYDDNRLKIAPCRYYGSVYTDDLIICGHSYKTHFKYLSNLKQKDVIMFTDMNGKSYVYEVLEIEVLDSNNVIEMIDNDYDLTLYTCTDDGFHRITVRCNKVVENI